MPTLAPSRAKSRELAPPMPVAPPEIRATLPASRPAISPVPLSGILPSACHKPVDSCHAMVRRRRHHRHAPSRRDEPHRRADDRGPWPSSRPRPRRPVAKDAAAAAAGKLGSRHLAGAAHEHLGHYTIEAGTLRAARLIEIRRRALRHPGHWRTPATVAGARSASPALRRPADGARLAGRPAGRRRAHRALRAAASRGARLRPRPREMRRHGNQ